MKKCVSHCLIKIPSKTEKAFRLLYATLLVVSKKRSFIDKNNLNFFEVKNKAFFINQT